MNHSNNEEQQPTVSQVAKEKVKKKHLNKEKKLAKSL